VKFGYYKRLGPRQRRIYDASDAQTSVRLPRAGDLHAVSERLAAALHADDRGATEAAAQALVDGALDRLRVARVQVRVLAVRPSTSREELHGLYEYGGRRTTPLISVWMRTAQRRQVVAFRTFLRTLLHEVAHHLDYRMLALADSYHTQGFYKRTESLYRQLAPPSLRVDAGRDAATTGVEAAPAIPAESGSPPLSPSGRIPLPAPPSRRIPAPAPMSPAGRRTPPAPARSRGGAKPQPSPSPRQPSLFDLD